MSRLKTLRAYIEQELNKIEDPDKRNSALVHLYGVSLSAVILAGKRKEDAELAAMAAMLHDIHAYESGSYHDHAHLGAKRAEEILKELSLTSDEETKIITSAIYHHDDKELKDSPMDELLKDADVIHHCMNDLSKPVKDKEKARFMALCSEFDLVFDGGEDK